MPKPGYNRAVKDLCRQYGSLYIADEVQTGLLRTGNMWGWQTFDVQPDIFVTAKGLSGGIYPVSACVVNEQAGGWLKVDGSAHISTAGGAEVGCFVGIKVLEILERPEVIANVQAISEYFTAGFAQLKARYPDLLVGIRQCGLVIGVEFNHPEGAVHASRALYENGVWAMFSSLDKRVLQFKPGVLMNAELCQEIVDRFDAAMPRARALMGRSNVSSNRGRAA